MKLERSFSGAFQSTQGMPYNLSMSSSSLKNTVGRKVAFVNAVAKPFLNW